jgi:hypothetical protein
VRERVSPTTVYSARAGRKPDKCLLATLLQEEYGYQRCNCPAAVRLWSELFF